MGSRLALFAILAGALAFPTVASAQKSDRGGHSSGGVSHAAGPPAGVRSGGPSTGAFHSGNRGAVVHTPRLSPGIVQHQFRGTPQYRVSPRVVQHQYRGTPQYRVSPGVVKHARLRQHTSRIYTQRRMQSHSGKHHRRHRHRQRGYAYYYGGWWYASPWWLGSYSDYDYWSDVCASRWGYGTPGYYSCMAYYGFY